MIQAQKHLPLRPVQFAVLLSLSGEPLAGFAIMEHVNRQLHGAAIIGPGTLYRLLKEMREAGLIERGRAPKGQGDDARRHFHQLTPLGREVMSLETSRLRRALDLADLPRLAGG